MSLIFLAVWFTGDIANLIGATWAGLIPSAIALAGYFCLADSMLISQCLYYRISSWKQRHKSVPSTLRDDDDAGSLLSSRHSLAGIVMESNGLGAWIKNVMSVLLVCAAGTAGWFVAYLSGIWRPTPERLDSDDGMVVGAQVLGYFSAFCYLGARFPQIIKNLREQSCEGLSLQFFLFCLLGNVTYATGV